MPPYEKVIRFTTPVYEIPKEKGSNDLHNLVRQLPSEDVVEKDGEYKILRSLAADKLVDRLVKYYGYYRA